VDRLVGALFGAIRIALIAVMLVLIFDSIIPANREPRFLAESHLRPLLSMAGQRGLKSLPPDVTAFIDQLKKERRL
jgi:membrane protein required for colicin V production